MSFGRQLPTSARPSIPESYETETIAMEPVFTVGLGGLAKRLVHQEQTHLQELVPRLVNVGNLVVDDTQNALPRVASESEQTVPVSLGLAPAVRSFLGSASLAVMDDAQKQPGQVFRPWHEKFPHAESADAVRLEGPTGAVVGAAEGGELLFVGRRERRPALAMPLRPVTQASPQQVRRPVAVVPHG
ncbi:adenine nucleotide alpha hydrolase family protein [Streptomyces zaomyceticus]|uniref:hypothetical protein n=1 Tax=Streptomyces zaomyceticus TaxID=68286 RepID=UPI002E1C65EB